MPRTQFNPYLAIARTKPEHIRTFGPKLLIEPNRQTGKAKIVSPGQYIATPFPTHRFIRLRVQGHDYALRCEGINMPEEFYGPYINHSPFGLAFVPLEKKPKESGTVYGQLVRSIAVTWQVMQPQDYEETMPRIINDRRLANEIEFLEPLVTHSSRPFVFRDTGTQNLTRGIPFLDDFSLEQRVGPLIEEENIADQNWEKLITADASQHDDSLTSSILTALRQYFPDHFNAPGNLLLDPMLGTGNYLKTLLEGAALSPAQIAVGDVTPKILEAFDCPGVAKYTGDAQDIFERLGQRKADVKVAVLRGCNFNVVTHAKAKDIFRHVYENLPLGGGIIITGITRVLFDSTFIATFPGAKILQRVTWNTHGVLLPFYVVVKETV